MIESEKYNECDCIVTHVYDIIIDTNNPSKYINDIEQHFYVLGITDFPYY